MNKVILSGNLTRDPELRNTSSSNVCRFTVAVQRPFKNSAGEREVDFISCVAWSETAEFIAKYFTKGRGILLEGNIRTGSYEAQDGSGTRYTTDVNVDRAEFMGGPREATGSAREYEDAPHVVDDDEDLPF